MVWCIQNMKEVNVGPNFSKKIIDEIMKNVRITPVDDLKEERW